MKARSERTQPVRDSAAPICEGKSKFPTSRFRLLVIGVRWPPETFIARRLADLVNRGVKVSVVTSSRDARSGQSSNMKLTRLARWDDPTPIALARGIKQSAKATLSAPKSSISLLRAAQSHHGWWKGSSVALRTQLPLLRPEADIIHFEWNLTAVQYLPLVKHWRRPIVISCRGSQINVPLSMSNSREIELGIRTSFQMATAVHCVSEAIAKEAQRYGLGRERAWVIRPAVDTSYFRPPKSRARKDSKLLLVATGSLVWRKGYEYCLMAIKRLTDQGIPLEFHIIGDGPERQRVLFTVADLGLEDHVHLHGHLQPDDVRSILWDCHAFILASVTEGISNAALEAMACGLPVIVTDAGGMREVVRDGIDGYLVPPRDPEALARAVERLKHPRARQALGGAARTRIERNHSLEAQTDRFVELYDSVLAGWKAIG